MATFPFGWPAEEEESNEAGEEDAEMRMLVVVVNTGWRVLLLSLFPKSQGSYHKVLKNLHAEQLSKVQSKHHQECELLEDMK